MADISKLKGITEDETAKLRAANVKTIEQLWLRISEEQDDGLTPLATQTGIKTERLMELLVAEGLRNTGKFGSSWLKQHWLDLVLIAGLLSLIALVWRIWR
jgi:hypothetical protein